MSSSDNSVAYWYVQTEELASGICISATLMGDDEEEDPGLT